jgi:hypothetical protein
MVAKAARCTATVRMLMPRTIGCRRAKRVTSGVASAQGSQDTSSIPKSGSHGLQAIGPHPSLGEQAQVFGRFVGIWDGEYAEFSKDGRTTHSSGEWIFGWIMDGRAIQDLFIIHPSAARKERYIGTTLRYFDPKSGAWSVTFIDPENGSVATLTGGAVEDGRIVLHGQNKDGKETRWSFDEMRPDSWVFRDEETSDGGKTWRLREEDHMKRRGAAHARCDHRCMSRWLA